MRRIARVLLLTLPVEYAGGAEEYEGEEEVRRIARVLLLTLPVEYAGGAEEYEGEEEVRRIARVLLLTPPVIRVSDVHTAPSYQIIQPLKRTV